MRTIKETLEGLKPDERDKLMIAFEHGIAQHVVLPNGRFIGVNVKTIGGLVIQQETANGWAIGELKQ